MPIPTVIEDSILTQRRDFLAATLAALHAMASPVRAQSTIENELTLITPVSRFIYDAALNAFAKYVLERWNMKLRTNVLEAGTPVAYKRILQWKGRPEVDIFWGGESALFDKLADQKILAPLKLPKSTIEAIPPTIGKPRPIYLKDPRGFWTGTALESYGVVYHPALLKRLGIAPPRDWDDLLNPRLRGQIVQCAPSRSSSSHATYEVILQQYGDVKGWEWLKQLAANTGLFTARSRDVPAVVAKGEFAVGFAVPSYMAFEERLTGFDIRFVAPKTAWITAEPIAILTGAKHPQAARAFIEFLLTERGQKLFLERGLFPITPKYHAKGEPGSDVEKAVAFTGGMRSYFDQEVINIYDDDKAQLRYYQVNERFHKDIEPLLEKSKRR